MNIGQRVYFVSSVEKEIKKCSAQNATFWAIPRLYGPTFNRDRRYCEKKEKRGGRHITTSSPNSWRHTHLMP